MGYTEYWFTMRSVPLDLLDSQFRKANNHRFPLQNRSFRPSLLEKPPPCSGHFLVPEPKNSAGVVVVLRGRLILIPGALDELGPDPVDLSVRFYGSGGNLGRTDANIRAIFLMESMDVLRATACENLDL